MAKQVELNNRMSKGSSQIEIRPVWNNVQRVNHKNQFVPTTLLTRTSKIPVSTARASGTNNVSTARHNFNSQAVLTNAARKISTVKPFVNRLVLLGEKGKLLLSPQQVVIGDQKDITGTKSPNTMVDQDYPHRTLQNKGIVDSGCSRHMTGNKAYLAEYQDFNGGPVAFGGSKGYITGKGKIKTGKLDFEDVCFVKELQHFNLFSVSQICDKKNKVLFTDSECLVLSPEFKLPDANQVLLRIPRQNNMYSFNLENIVPSGGLACLIAKATIDESNKWNRRLGHVNFKNLNKLVKGNLVRGLPSKIFQNDHTCVACQKGKQHKASCKAKSVSSISQPLQLLHMDLFGPTSVRSLNHKTYCLVITDDFSRFSWVFFLRTKDETSGILKDFIRQIENQLNQKVKTIRCDNGTEFKNRDFIEFCGSKGIKREYSNARTPQQNGVAERKNMTLIEAARTMLADSFLPNTFWAEAVSTACYVLNRVLVTKPQNKTPYELITGKIPIISYIRPFGCHVTILNTIDHLGKFDGKSDEGFLVGYSLQSKAFRVYNLETKRVQANLHITFLENKPNVARKGPTWLFDLDHLTDSMNYQPVRLENQANKHAGLQEANQNASTEDYIDAGDSPIEAESAQDYFVLPIWSSYTSTVKNSKAGEEPTKHHDFKQVDKEDQVFLDELERLKRKEQDANDAAEALKKEFAQETEDLLLQVGAAKASSTNIVNTASTPVSTASPYVADFTNLEPVVDVSPIPTSRIKSIHPSTLILGDLQSAVQTRSKVTKSSGAYAFKAIGTKWVYINKKDERGVVVRNKARLVAQGHRQEEGINYDEVFAPVARIEAIRIFLAFASYMGFIVYQMDVKSVFMYGKIDEEVYVSQPLGFIDPKYPKKVYKVVKALYAPRAWYATLSTFLLKNGYRRGTIDKTLFIKKDKHDIILVQVYVDDIIFSSTKKSWCDEFEALMKSIFQMSSMGELTFFLGLQVKQKEDCIFISQDKYVVEILKKFDFVSVKTASTPIKTHKPLVKDEEASDVVVHLYRSMIGSLMYLTASRPDIMFTVCACSRFQVTPKTSHLSVVKRIFRYLKGKPKLGLWYPRVSSFDLEAYSDSDYARANLERKSTTGGCQFLGRRLISWQCKKQTIMATSTTEAEYVVAANCYGQVLWIQNQLLDYGFNFMNIKIYIDNESTICIVKNPVYHSKTKHIAIRHHFIRGAYEKKLIQVLKIHTDDNVADLLTKAFDKTDGNAKFHEIIDFLARSSIHNALTVSPVVSTTFVEQFWMSAKSKVINNVRYITAKVAGKPVSISETSIRSDLLFDDADRIDSLPNQAIFDATQLMGKVTPLFSNMLVQPTKDEGEQSERPSEPQPTPYPPHLKDSGGNQGGQSSSDRSLSGNEGSMTLQSVYDLCISLCTQLTDQAKEIKHLKAQIKKLKKKAKPVITHHRAWMKSGRKSGKAEPSVHKDPLFDELDDDEINNMETEYAQGIGRTRYMVHEEKERKEKEVSTEDALGIDKQKDSTDRPDEGTDDQTKGRYDPQTPPTTTSIIFGDDETIAQVLLNMSQAKAVSREKKKGVELKDIEETKRPRPTSTRSLLTLKPLLKIDPKDKGKKKIEEEDESDTESEGIPEAEKKFKQLARDEEMARKVQEDWETEEERKRLAEEEATNAALIQDFDDIKARMEADRLLALRLQEEERAVHYGRESKIPS
ncbi:putative ribonuclease H-like domain-containing protein [Tanacetum coccineum]